MFYNESFVVVENSL